MRIALTVSSERHLACKRVLRLTKEDLKSVLIMFGSSSFMTIHGIAQIQ